VLLQALLADGAAPLKDVIVHSNLGEQAAQEAVDELFASGQLVDLDGRTSPKPDSLVISERTWQNLSQEAVEIVAKYHQSFPLRWGMPKEELRSRLKLNRNSPVNSRLFNAAVKKLVSEAQLEENGPLLLIPGYTIQLTEQQRRQTDNLLRRFAASPYTPPSVKESQAEVGEDLYQALIDQEVLIPLSGEVVFRKEDYESMVAEVRKLIEKEGTVSAAQVRDHFNTSRRYALALLEHLDAVGLTIREGDVRRLRRV
jgi:selenocysteine-specific elongation factor